MSPVNTWTFRVKFSGLILFAPEPVRGGHLLRALFVDTTHHAHHNASMEHIPRIVFEEDDTEAAELLLRPDGVVTLNGQSTWKVNGIDLYLRTTDGNATRDPLVLSTGRPEDLNTPISVDQLQDSTWIADLVEIDKGARLKDACLGANPLAGGASVRFTATFGTLKTEEVCRDKDHAIVEWKFAPSDNPSNTLEDYHQACSNQITLEVSGLEGPIYLVAREFGAPEPEAGTPSTGLAFRPGDGNSSVEVELKNLPDDPRITIGQKDGFCFDPHFHMFYDLLERDDTEPKRVPVHKIPKELLPTGDIPFGDNFNCANGGVRPGGGH